MIRAVLDANVLVSGFPASRGVPATLLDLWAAGRYELVVSEPLLAEVARSWQQPYYLRRYPPAQAVTAIARLRAEARLTPLTSLVTGVATHPEDDLILATAISAAAVYLVTGDHHLLQLGTFQDVTILSPRAFLDLLEADFATAP